MESRTLLAVTYSVSGSTITFTGLAQDSLYLQTAAGGVLQYHDETSTTYAATPINLTAQDTTIEVYVGGTLHLDGLSSSGKAVSIEGPAQESRQAAGERGDREYHRHPGREPVDHRFRQPHGGTAHSVLDLAEYRRQHRVCDGPVGRQLRIADDDRE